MAVGTTCTPFTPAWSEACSRPVFGDFISPL